MKLIVAPWQIKRGHIKLAEFFRKFEPFNEIFDSIEVKDFDISEEIEKKHMKPEDPGPNDGYCVRGYRGKIWNSYDLYRMFREYYEPSEDSRLLVVTRDLLSGPWYEEPLYNGAPKPEDGIIIARDSNSMYEVKDALEGFANSFGLKEHLGPEGKYECLMESLYHSPARFCDECKEYILKQAKGD